MAVLAVNGTIEPQQYAAIVERTDELARLRAQAQRRRSMLIFGPEVVGKTRLLRSFLQTQPLALFAPQVQSPHEMLLALIEELRRVARPGITHPANCTSLRTGSLKGIV